MVYNSVNNNNIPQKRFNIIDIKKAKNPLVCLTAYTAYQAKIIDDYTDIILVGDSVGMVVYGLESTLGVTLDMMINHGKAVVNATKKSLMVVDMPFSSYESSKEQAFINAARIMSETNCQAIKLEGGEHMAPTIEFLTKRGIPVMAHIGLTPQSINNLGGFRVQGRDEKVFEQIKQDLKAIEEAGSFSVVIEAVTESLANELTKLATIPTIGIGASNSCDGQIVVSEDMLGYFDKTPKFVRRYADLQENMRKALMQYAEDVRNRSFPNEKEVYCKSK